MTVRLQATECTMFFINCEILATQYQGQALTEWLMQLTQKLKVPVIFADLNSHSESEIHALLPVAPKLGEAWLRPKLLIAGGDLEGGISLVTLEALAIGFEVFLVADLISVSDECVAKFCWDRLVQAGAVPTTVTQVSLEIISNDPAEVAQSEIKELLSVFRDMRK